MPDFESNTYSSTAQLIQDAIERSASHNETVTILVNAARHEGIEEALLVECEGHDDHGFFWGEGWQIRIAQRAAAAAKR